MSCKQPASTTTERAHKRPPSAMVVARRPDAIATTKIACKRPAGEMIVARRPAGCTTTESPCKRPAIGMIVARRPASIPAAFKDCIRENCDSFAPQRQDSSAPTLDYQGYFNLVLKQVASGFMAACKKRKGEIASSSDSDENLAPKGQVSSAASFDMAKKPFRTLVVVPRSHSDGTFKKLCQGKSKGEVKCHAATVARAVQLDLRCDTSCAHRSLLVAWDSRLVHQGHTHVPSQTSGWSPRLYKPKIFTAEESIEWNGYLLEEGYVAIAHVLSEADVRKALSLLLQDLQNFSPDLKSLNDARESDLPPSLGSNDLRHSAGLCHGRFAWFLRSHPSIGNLFEKFFNVSSGAPLVGSVDVVALAPPGMSNTSGSGRQWLHLDYFPPHGRILQTTLQLFPDQTTDGCMWERIAIMICKAPVHWAANPRCESSLLACYITGSASRATKGVTLGSRHGKTGKPHHNGYRLLPELASTPFTKARFRQDGSIDTSLPPSSLMNLRILPVEEILQRLSAEEMRRLVPEHVLRYISPETSFDAEASARTHASVVARFGTMPVEISGKSQHK